ncbi:hypothetical protein KCU81_g8512, partial [Aureobasidium melanogenum]
MANKLLRAVWLENNNDNHIVKTIITATTPAAAEAISYAVMETRVCASMDSDEQPPADLWLPNLSRIVDLCTSALAAYIAHRKLASDRSTMPTRTVEIPSPESYYLVRRCVLAFEFTEARDALYEEISAASRERLAEACDMQHFLNQQSSMKESIHQGVLFRMRFYESVGEDFSEDDLELHEDGRNYANDVLGTAD